MKRSWQSEPIHDDLHGTVFYDIVTYCRNIKDTANRSAKRAEETILQQDVYYKPSPLVYRQVNTFGRMLIAWEHEANPLARFFIVLALCSYANDMFRIHSSHAFNWQTHFHAKTIERMKTFLTQAPSVLGSSGVLSKNPQMNQFLTHMTWVCMESLVETQFQVLGDCDEKTRMLCANARAAVVEADLLAAAWHPSRISWCFDTEELDFIQNSFGLCSSVC